MRLFPPKLIENKPHFDMYIMSKLTPFEMARLIGTRAEQIARGAKPLVDTTGLYNPYDIAMLELKEGKIPISIIRTLPDGQQLRVDIVPK